MLNDVCTESYKAVCTLQGAVSRQAICSSYCGDANTSKLRIFAIRQQRWAECSAGCVPQQQKDLTAALHAYRMSDGAQFTALKQAYIENDEVDEEGYDVQNEAQNPLQATHH